MHSKICWTSDACDGQEGIKLGREQKRTLEHLAYGLLVLREFGLFKRLEYVLSREILTLVVLADVIGGIDEVVDEHAGALSGGLQQFFLHVDIFFLACVREVEWGGVKCERYKRLSAEERSDGCGGAP